RRIRLWCSGDRAGHLLAGELAAVQGRARLDKLDGRHVAAGERPASRFGNFWRIPRASVRPEQRPATVHCAGCRPKRQFGFSAARGGALVSEIALDERSPATRKLACASVRASKDVREDSQIIQEKEAHFHDEWARSTPLDKINVREAFEA